MTIEADLNAAGYTDGDIDTNLSSNPTFESIVQARYSRRQTLFGGAGATAAAFLGGAVVTACGDDDDKPAVNAPGVTAGSNATTSAGKAVTLTGSAVASSGSLSSAGWTQVSGPTVALTDANSNTARFIAPAVSAPTPLVFRFSATDARGTAAADTTITVEPARLDFTAVSKNLNDIVSAPPGYSVQVLYRLGDPINAATPAYANNGADAGFSGRAGDHHDALSWYGLAATGSARDDNSNTRGILVMNHENISQRYLHPNGPTGTGAGQSRPEAEALKEIEAHGVSQVEVVRGSTGWTYVQSSPLNARITPNTPVAIHGPARGAAAMRTKYSPTGVAGRGTINNCGNGYMPWGTNLTCEENWGGYFRRAAGDNAARGGATAKAVVSLSRYGLSDGANGNYGWASVTPADGGNTTFARWNASALAGQPADGTGDFRNEPNHFGWCVELDPYNPAAAPRKRTAMGRFAKEGAWPSIPVPGRRLAFYMGDDARGEYIYKFVSAVPWSAADATAADRLAVGDKYLDAGTLYVARFDASGSGAWLPLVFGQGPLTAANAAYAFADQADVLINARLAGDALGATKMDRPEWTGVNPRTGEMYVTLTNNTAAVRPITATDAANPRFYNDPKGASGSAQLGNPNGHILRLRETGDNSEALTFTWDIYAFGAGSDLNPTNVNVSGLDATNDFSSPDGLWFSRPTNAAGQVTPLLWIQTDDGAYTDVTNCMMLAALPGTVGDGGARTITNTGADGSTRTQSTFVGKAPGVTLKRFLVGPKECEITGMDTTPDGRTLFVNIQHPGEDTATGFPNTFPSNWPASQTNPSAVSRPRSATIVITKDDGGIVGL